MKLLYNFDCGCSIDENDVVVTIIKPSNQRKTCPAHIGARLVGRTSFCEVCGCEIDLTESGVVSVRCKKHKKKYDPKGTATGPVKGTILRGPPKRKWRRGKYCKNLDVCFGPNINCVGCKDFDPIFFGHDPEKRDIVMGMA